MTLWKNNDNNLIRYSYKKANWLLFKTTLENDLSLKNPVIDVDEAYNRLVIASKRARDNTIPVIKGPFKHKYSPFWNDDCSAAKKTRKEAEKELRKCNSVMNLIAYKKSKVAFRKIYAKNKKEYWENYCASLNYNSKTANVWKTVKNIKGKDIAQNFAGVSKDKEIVDKKKLADKFAKVFNEVSSDTGIGQEMINHRKITVENFLKNYNIESTNVNDTLDRASKIINQPFNINELDHVLRKVKIHSAPGCDDMPYTFFIHSPDTIKIFIVNLINNCWMTGKIPSTMKHSVIKPILKPMKDKADINSYRPISLTPTTSKIMEKNDCK